MSASPMPGWACRLTELRRDHLWVESDLAVALKKIRSDLPPVKSLVRSIQQWEAGEHKPAPRYRMLLAAVYNTSEERLFGASFDEPTRGMPQHIPPGSVEATYPSDWDEMERRFLLRLAATGMGAGALGSAPLNTLVDLALTSEPRDLDDWHLACDDHLHGLRTRPPAQVRDDLIVDLLAIGRQLRAADAAQMTELRRVEAALATLHANVLTRLGDHGTAIRWWRTAKADADAAGDLELRLGIRATEAGHGLYGQRHPATVLRLTQDAQELAGDAPSHGKALVACSQAKALTRLGRHGEARQVLDTYIGLAEAAPEARGIMPRYWNAGQATWTEVQVYAAAGDEARAESASNRALAVLATTADSSYVPQVALQKALCTVVNGGVDTGTRRATEILADLPPTQQSRMITETGKTVLRAVPLDQRDRPAVRDLRALTAGT